MACEATADIQVEVDPDFLFELAEAASEEMLTLEFRNNPQDPLRVRGSDGFTALLMPRSRIEGARAWFEDLLVQLLGTTPDLLERDREGDYLIQLADNHRMYVRLAPGELDMGTPDRAQVFSVLAEGVEATLELLTELNDLNASIGPARIFLIEGRRRACGGVVQSR